MFTAHDSLFFLHIPKTAGTSLIDWLAGQFGPDETCPWGEARLYEAATDSALAQYRFLHGHLRAEFIQRMPAHTRTITWLRDPTARLFSSYRYLRNLDAETAKLFIDVHAHKQLEAARRCRFEEWLRLPREDFFHHDHVAFTLAPFETRPELVVQHAAAFLESLEMFGLVERMQDSIDLLCYRFAWLPQVMRQRLNATIDTEASSWSDEARAIAARNSPRDHELQAIAVRRFEQRWQNMLDDLRTSDVLPEQWEALPGRERRAALHAAIERHVRFARQHCTRPRNGRVTVDRDLPVRGFTPMIRPDTTNFPDLIVRWLGPAPVGTVYLSFPRACASQLSFTICEAADFAALTALEIRINGQRVPCSIEPAPEPIYPLARRVTALVPWEAVCAEPGLARVEFRLPHLWPKPAGFAVPDAPDLIGFSIRDFSTEAAH